ncbi:metallophosphoesterase family protein [Paracidobacterium acidisoli]|uniref:Phosphoesterase n=1 Tax=Paracidobacterium acidisoli TaxID=2303751 RepID=A0A372IKP0_9BACT|nr:metallophosphoesterase family protein [Paracidobacterium acidisoli]MBT9332705.1 metallophosphatase family protein [Paracidobacterium acidisoli]
MRIGVISDTHGLLRPEAVEALRGSDQILHAGDVGDAAILERLSELAPVTAIRGNVDRTGACAALAETELIELGGIGFYLIHDRNELDLDPVAASVGVVVSGHSHKPAVEEGAGRHAGVLYFNPGSAGPRRFSLPLSVGRIEIREGRIEAQIVLLEAGG